ncbi:hypothetical protein AKJ58_00735 [candidate division MSBL1 archaeon SCGC-AAA385D11]|uniref:SpoVT-AbrB domain-containing protein n=1 Tax=candidate division MSBL1 archaeon SCGC-AAA385D11 TaxID=1698286 RepID=A0A133VP00_9EURY|nr:hypothetical protein AKJ58_00735 [candidate division MSBL1 archaeon SCGC-AAA385D11]
MVRKKKLSPSGVKGEDGKYHNAHVSLNEDELNAAGLKIGDEVFIRVREDMIIIQKAEEWPERKPIFVERIPVTGK